MARQIIKLGEIVKSAWGKVNANFEELYSSIGTIPNKVDKEAGKGLSENNYTTTDKDKLAGIESGAEVNVLESVKVNGTALSVSDKAVNIDLSTYAKKTDIASAYRYKGSKATYADLPTSGNTAGDVWNVETDDMNYAWTGSKWDPLGASVDLSGYATTEAMNTALGNKVDKVSGKGLSTNDFTAAYKTKLDGLSAPTKETFLAGGWGNANNGVYTMTIAAAGKYPTKVFRQNSSSYEEALVQVAVNGNNVVLTSEEAFAGYVVLI